MRVVLLALFCTVESSFQFDQSIATVGALDLESCEIEGKQYLVVANSLANSQDGEIDSKIWQWNGERFVEFQSIPTSSALDVESFEIDGVRHFTVADNRNDSEAECNDLTYDGDPWAFPTDHTPGYCRQLGRGFCGDYAEDWPGQNGDTANKACCICGGGEHKRIGSKINNQKNQTTSDSTDAPTDAPTTSAPPTGASPGGPAVDPTPLPTDGSAPTLSPTATNEIETTVAPSSLPMATVSGAFAPTMTPIRNAHFFKRENDESVDNLRKKKALKFVNKIYFDTAETALSEVGVLMIYS